MFKEEKNIKDKDKAIFVTTDKPLLKYKVKLVKRFKMIIADYKGANEILKKDHPKIYKKIEKEFKDMEKIKKKDKEYIG